LALVRVLLSTEATVWISLGNEQSAVEYAFDETVLIKTLHISTLLEKKTIFRFIFVGIPKEICGNGGKILSLI